MHRTDGPLFYLSLLRNRHFLFLSQQSIAVATHCHLPLLLLPLLPSCPCCWCCRCCWVIACRCCCRVFAYRYCRAVAVVGLSLLPSLHLPLLSGCCCCRVVACRCCCRVCACLCCRVVTVVGLPQPGNVAFGDEVKLQEEQIAHVTMNFICISDHIIVHVEGNHCK